MTFAFRFCIRFAVAMWLVGFATSACFGQYANPTFPEKTQEMSKWGWAACSQATLEFYGTNVSQSNIAQYATGGANVTNVLFDTNNASVRGINMILTNFASLATTPHAGVLTIAEMWTELNDYRPLILQYDIAGHDSKFIVVYGYINFFDGSFWIKNFFVMDPQLGHMELSYDQIYTNNIFGASATWTRTLKMTNSATPKLLEVALNTTNVTWRSSGPPIYSAWADTHQVWSLQKTMTHDGVSAAKSGWFMMPYGDSYFESIPLYDTDPYGNTITNVGAIQGPGNFTFWWRVESEEGFDFFTFYIDGVEQAKISGITSWTQMSYDLGYGGHILSWHYTKDAYTEAGADAGFVDEVMFNAPQQPAVLFASDGTYDDRIQIAWPQNNMATGYQVWRGTNYTGSDRTFLANTPTPSFSDTSANPVTLYYYWIKAQNGFGVSSWSVADFGFRNLSAPLGVSASAGTTDIVRVNWATVPDAASYEVYRNTANNSSTATLIGDIATNAISDTTATPGQTCYYWILAKRPLVQGVICRSAFSAVVSGWRTMSTPQNAQASNGSFTDRVLVSWSAAAGATGYEVWRNTSDYIFQAIKVKDTTLTSCDDLGATPGIVYYYWVRANSQNGFGPYSASASGFAATNSVLIPAAPSGVLASDGTYPDRVRVQWPTVTGADSYEVWRNIFNYLGTAEWVADAVGTRYEDFSVADNTPYYYWLRAKNSAGVSGYSAPDSGYRLSSPEPHPSVIASNVVNDYNGDRASELTLFGVSNGTWNAKSISNSVTLAGIAWGSAEMTPVPGDYDGDRVSDLAVYNEASGVWYVRTTGGSILFWGHSWGAPGYVPVRGDYDGDGRADFALYNAEQGQWCILSANGTVLAWLMNFGGPGLNAVPGDYDGDGRFDMVLFDPELDRWYAMNLSGRILLWNVSWGNPGCVPVPGDYNGDRISDLAVYNTIAGYWYIRTVSGAVLVWNQNWGGPAFRPVSGDFDADGYGDLAVYGEFNGAGVWYIMTVGGNVLAWNMAWGGPDSTVVGLAE